MIFRHISVQKSEVQKGRGNLHFESASIFTHQHAHTLAMDIHKTTEHQRDSAFLPVCSEMIPVRILRTEWKRYHHFPNSERRPFRQSTPRIEGGNGLKRWSTSAIPIPRSSPEPYKMQDVKDACFAPPRLWHLLLF